MMALLLLAFLIGGLCGSASSAYSLRRQSRQLDEFSTRALALGKEAEILNANFKQKIAEAQLLKEQYAQSLKKLDGFIAECDAQMEQAKKKAFELLGGP